MQSDMDAHLAVRSMLVNTETGQYVKALEQRDLREYFELVLAKEKEDAPAQLFDISLIIQHIDGLLNERLAEKEAQEVLVKKDTAFSVWRRFTSFSDRTRMAAECGNVVTKCIEVMEWLLLHVGKRKNLLIWAKEIENGYSSAMRSEKTQHTEFIIKDVDAFLEMLLCCVHAEVKVDLGAFRQQDIWMDYCSKIHVEILKLLRSELQLTELPRNRDDDYMIPGLSAIKYICAEVVDINADALLQLCLHPKRAVDVMSEMWGARQRSTEYSGNNLVLTLALTCIKPSDDKLNRIKMLLLAMQKILAVVDFIRDLQRSNVVLNENREMNEQYKGRFGELIRLPPNSSSYLPRPA